MTRDLELAASVARQLDELAERDGARVLLIARAGQNLSGIRAALVATSASPIATRRRWAGAAPGAWCKAEPVRQRPQQPYRQGLAEFFGDGLWPTKPALPCSNRRWPPACCRNCRTTRCSRACIEPRYNMLAYPWSGPYQQSNQWAIETLALLAEPAVGSRSRRAPGCGPSTTGRRRSTYRR